MSYAYMNISAEVLRHCLALPEDADIVSSVECDSAGWVRILVGHETIPEGATEVTGIVKKIHGVTVFDRFEITELRKQPCEACGH